MKVVNIDVAPTSVVERVIYVSLHIISLIASLVGDSVILIGTIKYRAIKQHKVIVAIIQHLAILDILASVFYVLPKSVTLITDRWEFGAIVCYVYFYFWSFYQSSSFLLTWALPIVKLIIVKYPLRAVSWSLMIGCKICAALYIFSFILISPMAVFDIFFSTGDSIYFDNVSYFCFTSYDPKVVNSWRYMIIVLAVVSITLCSTMMAASVALLVIANRSAARLRESLNWEGVATIVITVVVFTFSYMPYNVEALRISQGNSPLFVDNPRFYRFVTHLRILNVMVNFFIYCVTVRSFREFIKLQISQIYTFLRRRSVLPVNRHGAPPTAQFLEIEPRNVATRC